MIENPTTGMRVEVTKLGGTSGMFVHQKHLRVRAAGVHGTIQVSVPGHGGDVWSVLHDSALENAEPVIGAYCTDELEELDAPINALFRARHDRLDQLKEDMRLDYEQSLQVARDLCYAYTEGVRAFFEGLPADANPHPAPSGLWTGWQAGWTDAEDVDSRKSL